MTRRRPHRAAHAAPRSTAKRAEQARAAAPAALRIGAIDGLRGAALCLMIVYHFSFDLNWFGYIRADFDHDAFWLDFRGVIVSAFMLLVGLSLLLARRAGVTPRHFWRRIALIAFCAILVSVASYLTFPQTFITFGILHCIALASVLAWPVDALPARGAGGRSCHRRHRQRRRTSAVRHAVAAMAGHDDAQAADRGLRAAAAVAGRRHDRHCARTLAFAATIPPVAALIPDNATLADMDGSTQPAHLHGAPAGPDRPVARAARLKSVEARMVRLAAASATRLYSFLCRTGA